MHRFACASLLCFALAACGGGGSSPAIPPAPGGSTNPQATVVDASSQSCSVSYDGFVWYTVPAGGFSPIDVLQSKCARSSLSSNLSPARPAWSIPRGPTQTRFVATSLQDGDVLAGMQSIEGAAAPHGVPLSWMIGIFPYQTNADVYRAYHASNGDDVEASNYAPLVRSMRHHFPWYVPTVSVEGAGHERNIPGLLALGEHAFWGITWNSHGIDGTDDYGAPWGTYCADPKSYKRPQPNGACDLLAFEWTARDLTRAYLSGHEEYFSTDPDDLLVRAQFSQSGAQTYVRALVDAYAAAGETQPVVMVSQQESNGNTAADAAVLEAMYAQAVTDGMKIETLAAAAADARAFSAAPRAAAFPYIPGGVALPSSIVGDQKLYPATIDYHDATAGMSFLAGHTLPTRLFRYADDPTSAYDVPLASLPASAMPTLTAVALDKGTGTLALQFQAPIALHYGVAFWSDPSQLRITAAGSVRAGRAAVVVIFDLKPGANQVAFHCGGCRSTTLPYST
jgi:hypothetical protein